MPRSGAVTIFLCNNKNEEDEWEKLHLRIGSWVTMRPVAGGYHGVKRAKRSDCSAHWKGRVKEFVFGPGGKTVMDLIVEHAYDSHDMAKESISMKHFFPSLEPNSLCSSDFTDVVSAKSITSVLEVYHCRIGHLLFKDSTMRSLKERGIWFHAYHYTISAKGIGKLVEVDLPDLKLMGTEFLDCKLLTAYRDHLGREVFKNLRERGVRCSFKVFLPIHIFSYLFQSETSIRIAPQTYTIRDVSSNSLESIFSGQWKERDHETGQQITRCTSANDTFIFS